jgi:hypothetical protein
MRFGEVIQALMAGGGNAVWREDWGGSVFLRYSELWNVFELHGPKGRVTQLEELSLPTGHWLPLIHRADGLNNDYV